AILVPDFRPAAPFGQIRWRGDDLTSHCSNRLPLVLSHVERRTVALWRGPGESDCRALSGDEVRGAGYTGSAGAGDEWSLRARRVALCFCAARRRKREVVSRDVALSRTIAEVECESAA